MYIGYHGFHLILPEFQVIYYPYPWQVQYVMIQVSVATVTTNAFQKNWIMKPRKLVKTMRIFINIEHIKNFVTDLVTTS